jgi:hypothetical protein
MKSKRNNTTLTPELRAKLKPRGRSKQTLILEAIKESGALGLAQDATKEDAEKALFNKLSMIAFKPTEEEKPMATTCMNHLMSRGWAQLKPQDPCVEFDYDSTAKPLVQANQIMTAVAEGKVSPSIANQLITSLTNLMKISEITEIEERLEALEAAADEQD